jgi:signal transduction histidine kinase/ActR/RegA family two-component response regulator
MSTNKENELAKETISSGQFQAIFQGHNHVLDLLASGKPLTKTLDSLVKILESQLIHARCSILIVDKTGQYFSKGASPSLPDSYCDAIDGLPVGPDIGPCAMAAFKNKIVVVENIETDTRWESFKVLALSHNLKACWSTPIRSISGKVLGTLCPYYEKPFTPTENEFQMVRHAAYLAGIAIQLKQGDEALKEKNRLLKIEIKKRKKDSSLIAGQNRILEMLATEIELKEILDAITIMTQNRYKDIKCSILILDRETQKMHYVSMPNIPKGYIDALNEFMIGPQVGSCGTAAYYNKTVIVDDIANDPLWKGYAQVALDHGIKACWSVPVQDSKGEVLGTFALFPKDTRKPKEDEMEFIHSIGYLAGITIERKRIQEELVKSKEEAQAANRAKSDFLSKMSHELRTPMNSIMGFTQILNLDKKQPLSKNQKENLQFISSAGDHLLELVNEILDLSKIESGKLKLFIEPVDLVPIINDVISISLPLAINAQVSLEDFQNPNATCIVEADPLRIKQVLLNLTSNAIKYNKPNGSVKILLEKLDDGKIRLGLKDTGHGISDDKKNKIFKPFERFNLKANDIKGTGIGLTITKQLTELMHGSIGFESVFGEGSFFYIDIPISDKPCAPTHVRKEVDFIPSTPKNKSKKKILYIEDIKSNILLIEQIFDNRDDLELISAPNAMEGIKVAQTQLPDLILLDMNLLDKDGFETYEEVQTINTLKHIPVIALTADAMDISIQKAMDMGFKNYITKPIRITKLLNILDQIFSENSPSVPSSKSPPASKE